MRRLVLAILIFLISIHASESTFTHLEWKIGEAKTVTLSACTIIIFRTSYKRIQFEVSDAQNVQDILFTDKEFTANCESSDLYGICTSTNSVCTYSEQVRDEINYEAGYCADKIYLYVKIKSGTNATLTIKSSLDESGKLCDNLIDDYRQKQKYIKCASIPVSTCKSKCQLDCTHYSCSGSQPYDLCLPRNLTEIELIQRCQAYDKYAAYVKTDLCENIVNKTQAQAEAHPLYIVTVFGLICWLVMICIYNILLRRKREVPFSVPDCCPQLCFPRSVERQEDILAGNLNINLNQNNLSIPDSGRESHHENETNQNRNNQRNNPQFGRKNEEIEINEY